MTYEQFLLALALWREARNANRLVWRAIMWVIRNRANDPRLRWPHTVIGVILEAKQFSSFNPGDPNSAKFPNPSDSLDWNAWNYCVEVVRSQDQTDPTMGATNYESEPGDKRPEWADPAKMTLQTGQFRFYKL